MFSVWLNVVIGLISIFSGGKKKKTNFTSAPLKSRLRPFSFEPSSCGFKTARLIQKYGERHDTSNSNAKRRSPLLYEIGDPKRPHCQFQFKVHGVKIKLHNMTRQWLTSPDHYICTLSPETQEIAKRELREDDNTRQQALDTMRNWIIKNPRIENCRLDSKFLLRFLRFTKFHVPLAEEVLERYLLLRQAYSLAFHNADFKNSRIQNLIDRGIIVISPKKDKLGRRVVLARVAPFDPYEYKNEDILRIAAIFHETLMEEEDSQVRGYVYIGDGKGIGFPYLTLFTPKEAVRLVKNGEKTIPMRHKEAHGFNIPSSLKFAVDFGFSLISDKYKKRIKIHSSLEELHQHVDKSLLPKEYGGVIPFSEMLEYTKQELEKYRSVILSHDQMKVNMEFYSERAKEGAVSALKHGMLCKMDSGLFESGLCGNFRKLEVD